jgi:membrane dipeptidase
MISDLLRIEGASDGRLVIVRTIAELDQAIERGALAAVMHLEGAEPIDEDLVTLEVLHAFGLRSLGLTWSRENAFAFGGTPAADDRVGERSDHAPGLKAAGKQLVRRCNELGIVVDMAHLNETGFWDVAEISNRPLMVSHANAYSLSPVTRNLTDSQLDAIRSSNGVIGVTFYTPMLRADAQNRSDTPLSAVADHLDYIRDRIGIDHVAIGSDFGTAPTPDSLKDATDLPKLWSLLGERGWSDSDLHLVAWANWVRVLDDTWS